ncbi:MAG: alpha/beta hydrolase [Maribacter sp.]|nr:alpha/beta hydrolase [Maribacter sp.]
MNFKRGYSEVNGLRMYYEEYGHGMPLVLIHGGGSTIQTSFGRIIPELSKKQKIIAIELQAHGRTNDRNADLSFQQDADDIAQLLNNLQIAKANFLGFSNGGHVTIEMALRHGHRINALILCSTFYNREGVFPGFWERFKGEVAFSDLPQPYKEAFLKVNNSTVALRNMFNKDVRRMQEFKGWSHDQMRSIDRPTLIINGNFDIGSPEHMVALYRLIPNSHLVIVPGGHGDYLGEITTPPKGKINTFYIVPIIEEFLKTAFENVQDIT